MATTLGSLVDKLVPAELLPPAPPPVPPPAPAVPPAPVPPPLPPAESAVPAAPPLGVSVPPPPPVCPPDSPPNPRPPLPVEPYSPPEGPAPPAPVDALEPPLACPRLAGVPAPPAFACVYPAMPPLPVRSPRPPPQFRPSWRPGYCRRNSPSGPPPRRKTLARSSPHLLGGEAGRQHVGQVGVSEKRTQMAAHDDHHSGEL